MPNRVRGRRAGSPVLFGFGLVGCRHARLCGARPRLWVRPRTVFGGSDFGMISKQSDEVQCRLGIAPKQRPRCLDAPSSPLHSYVPAF
jgi:hypothetical protein